MGFAFWKKRAAFTLGGASVLSPATLPAQDYLLPQPASSLPSNTLSAPPSGEDYAARFQVQF